MTDGAEGTPYHTEEQDVTDSMIPKPSEAEPPQEPPHVGDKVVYCGESVHAAWELRRTQVGIVVAEAQDAGYYNVVYSHSEYDTWRAKSASLHVVARATYTPVTAESAVDGA